MENGGSSNLLYKDYMSLCNSGIVKREPSNSSNICTNEHLNARKPDEYLPINNVSRIMEQVLPNEAKISDDAKETMQECVSEFIGFITSVANDKCRRECRTTIKAEDILSAMASLGFHNYVETLNLYLNRFRAQDRNNSMTNSSSFVQLLPMNYELPTDYGHLCQFINNYFYVQNQSGVPES